MTLLSMTAEYFDGRSARAHAVQLHIGEGRRRVTSGHGEIL